MSKLSYIRNKLVPSSLFIAFFFYNPAAHSDPVILPVPDPVDAPPVFCFKVTGGDVLPTGGARIQFEVLNWTGEAASFLQVQQSVGAPANTGGFFDFDTAATTAENGWTVDTGFDAGGIIFSAFDSGGGPGPIPSTANVPLEGIDLDPLNDLSFSAFPSVVPDPVDSGINTLDGFILEFPDLDPYERVVLQWTLRNSSFQPVDSPSVFNPFSFGTFQIDRGADGSVRVATAFSVGTTLFDIISNPDPLDPTLTDLNATTLPPTALAAVVPVPAALWLMLSGLAGLLGYTRTRNRLA